MLICMSFIVQFHNYIILMRSESEIINKEDKMVAIRCMNLLAAVPAAQQLYS